MIRQSDLEKEVGHMGLTVQGLPYETFDLLGIVGRFYVGSTEETFRTGDLDHGYPQFGARHGSEAIAKCH